MARHVGMLLQCFYKRRSSWRGRGNGKSQLAECATEIASECVDEKHFTPRRPILHVAAVLFAATEAVAANPASRKRNQVGFYRSLDGYSFTTDTAMEEEAT